jgi:hypothetical protein
MAMRYTHAMEDAKRRAVEAVAVGPTSHEQCGGKTPRAITLPHLLTFFRGSQPVTIASVRLSNHVSVCERGLFKGVHGCFENNPNQSHSH